ncbi:Na+/H+ antiporter NhaC [Lacrimispora sp. NSJ-141]|uniref:Na+/H+ antiporter NhaC n=1 Tax=Lientehia hominis TaxID=2897778 RepID=A0AAP2W7V5_9FIRM|nr:Na+/H+ antiporter NhaC [Lientehia hominis]MCD2492838.1 Na+/H+ antiporter NhaC [Lientehia hominis]
MSKEKESKRMGFPMAIFTLIVMVAIMAVGLAVLKLTTVTVFALVLVAMAIIAMCIGFSMNEVQEIILDGCKKAILVILILMSVGMVVGTWIVSGVVPSIIYYGLKILSPSYFLLVGFIICCIVSFFTGSSYTAAGTLGVAFMGIGYGIGINPGLTAGMVISGAIFGDKMSPFSDTTNLAPAVAGTDIFLHIKSMLFTTVPATIISAILYFVLGFQYNASNVDLGNVTAISEGITSTFNVSPFLLLIPILTIVLAIRKVPSFLALLAGTIAGIIVAFIAQPQFSIATVFDSMATGFKFDFANEVVAKLFNRGGISSMMTTVSLSLLCLSFGELLQRMGVLSAILGKLEALVRKPGPLVITTLFTCLLTVVLTASQYVSILLPGEIFKDSYDKADVAPYVLSRTLEDGGTIFSFLVPWSMAAIYVSGVLGVPTISSLPYSFLPLLCPVMAIIYGLTGFAIFKKDGSPVRGKGMWFSKKAKLAAQKK